MSTYHREQREALALVRRFDGCLAAARRGALQRMVMDYLAFRGDVARYLEANFRDICTATCFRSRISACCSREGIITFWGDVVVNVLESSTAELDRLELALQRTDSGTKCIYLGPAGCLWRVKPIVCEMFLCDTARQQIFGANPAAEVRWQMLREQKKRYTWPDRPVLFEALEQIFIRAGCDSPLMYLHSSPGLLRVKQRAGRMPPPVHRSRKRRLT